MVVAGSVSFLMKRKKRKGKESKEILGVDVCVVPFSTLTTADLAASGRRVFITQLRLSLALLIHMIISFLSNIARIASLCYLQADVHVIIINSYSNPFRSLLRASPVQPPALSIHHRRILRMFPRGARVIDPHYP